MRGIPSHLAFAAILGSILGHVPVRADELPSKSPALTEPALGSPPRPSPTRFDPVRIQAAPPAEWSGRSGPQFKPLLRFDNGDPVRTPEDWSRRRNEIRSAWHRLMGPWPPLLENPRLETLRRQSRDGESFVQRRVRIPIASDRSLEGWLLIPPGPGPFPAVLVPYYEPETSIGLDKPLRDFARQLTRRGFVTLSFGSPGGDARKPDLGSATCQPLSYLAYAAANACNAVASMPDVDPQRIGIVGHSYGGKWALFAACLHDRFAAAAWCDPGIVWDESRPNVNYWDVWYLGRDTEPERKPGVPSASNPTTGAYKALVAARHDLHELHALMAPRPFLVSGGSEDPADRWLALNHVAQVYRLLDPNLPPNFGMTLRPSHDPTEVSNEQIYSFFEMTLGKARPQNQPSKPPSL